MAFCAVDEDKPISAWDADPAKTYFCIECFAPVKVRRGPKRFPHFYHLANAPSCRLYSKSEDHLLLQLQLQKQLPKGEALLEQPISSISRISDLLWEKEKISFEIQCSQIEQVEVETRTREYRKAGYDIVWVLDDRIFNKRQLRPSEEFLRTQHCYFASFSRQTPSYFYDQFEIFRNQKRVKKGKKFTLQMDKVHKIPADQWPERLPRQIERRRLHCTRYFEQDLFHRTFLSKMIPAFAAALENWRVMELHQQHSRIHMHWLKKFLIRWVLNPYLAFLQEIAMRM